MEHCKVMGIKEYWRIVRETLDPKTGEVIEEHWMADISNEDHKWLLGIYERHNEDPSKRYYILHIPARELIKKTI